MLEALPIIREAGLTLAAVGAGVGASLLLGLQPAPRPTLGRRGLRRRSALRRWAPWRLGEPLVRTLAAPTSTLAPPGMRGRIDRWLRSADEPLGLTPSELLVMCGLFAATGGGAVLAFVPDPPALAFLVSAAVSGGWPLLRIDDTVRRRRTDVERQLPATLDLLAMSMQAGLDFAAALQLATGPGTPPAVLVDELRMVREDLRLGWTRRRAMEALNGRVDTPSLRQWTGAVIQAEASGSPLVDVMRVQATALRALRTSRAEAMAGRAAVMLTLPMMMMLCCVLLLLMGPAVLRMS